MTSGGCPAEALAGAFCPFRIRDLVRFSREEMVEDEFANSGPFGDAPDLVHVGVQRGHPFQGGPGDAVLLEVRQVGDLVDEDVGVLALFNG